MALESSRSSKDSQMMNVLDGVVREVRTPPECGKCRVKASQKRGCLRQTPEEEQRGSKLRGGWEACQAQGRAHRKL